MRLIRCAFIAVGIVFTGFSLQVEAATIASDQIPAGSAIDLINDQSAKNDDLISIDSASTLTDSSGALLNMIRQDPTTFDFARINSTPCSIGHVTLTPANPLPLYGDFQSSAKPFFSLSGWSLLFLVIVGLSIFAFGYRQRNLAPKCQECRGPLRVKTQTTDMKSGLTVVQFICLKCGQPASGLKPG